MNVAREPAWNLDSLVQYRILSAVHLLAREEIGLRCLLQVARRFLQGPMTIPAIAEAEGLSPEYAAKLMRRLRLGGLITSTRGAAGGYRLARAPEEITVWEAVQVLDDAFLPATFCDCAPGERRDCGRTAGCAVQSLWRRLGDQVRVTLEAVTLQNLCSGTEDRVELRMATP